MKIGSGIFNKNFYPTPRPLIEKMVSKLKYAEYLDSVLEPSAGNGNILDYLIEINRSGKTKPSIKFDCIEIEPELRSILKGKGYNVVHDDFLTYKGFTTYKNIIMNPPFDNGDKHLLRAIEIQERYGGFIVCLLNAETIKNPYSIIRKTLIQKLEEYNADIEFLENAFSNADRKTNVEVALVYLEVKSENGKLDNSIIYSEIKKAQELELEQEQDDNYQVTSGDFLTRIVETFNFECKSGLKLIAEYEKLKPMLSTVSDLQILSLTVFNESMLNNTERISNRFVEELRKKYWRELFNSRNFSDMFTDEMRYDFLAEIDKLEKYDFSKFNILEITRQMQSKLTPSLEKAVLKLFDDLTYNHSMSNDKNTHYYNGWKTNKAFKINETKVIVSININTYHTSTPVQRILDIERTLNFLDNGRTEGHSTFQEVYDTLFSKGERKNVEFKYFYCDFFQKGTCHLKWKDKAIVEKLNIFGGKHYNFLPDNYGKKQYNEMSKEEQDVIDSFQGKAEYEKVLRDTQYYLSNKPMVLIGNN